MINKQYWETLSAEDQEKIKEGVKKALERHYVDFLEQDNEAIEGCKTNGMQIVTDYDRPAFEKAVEPVYEKYQGIYGDWIKRIKDLAN
ncbi:hypothetical protein AGMMS50276_22210 [Synergistales bacterium]|nr:hypothetical protein AGMMS50276_22210 [Synergistales bacterium]